MTGEVGSVPVVVIEQKDGECRRTVGTRLVFRRGIEDMTMDAMTSTKCTPGPPA
jgi:hypothetical protein